MTGIEEDHPHVTAKLPWKSSTYIFFTDSLLDVWQNYTFVCEIGHDDDKHPTHNEKGIWEPNLVFRHPFSLVLVEEIKQSWKPFQRKSWSQNLYTLLPSLIITSILVFDAVSILWDPAYFSNAPLEMVSSASGIERLEWVRNNMT